MWAGLQGAPNKNVLKYVPFGATPKTGAKTSRAGDLFISADQHDCFRQLLIEMKQEGIQLAGPEELDAVTGRLLPALCSRAATLQRPPVFHDQPQPFRPWSRHGPGRSIEKEKKGQTKK